MTDLSIDYLKKNQRLLLERFCGLSEFPPSQKPFTIFMAGSPGAGKTEFSKSLIPKLKERDPKSTIVRIDADEIRLFFPMYNGSNSSLIQPAAALGVQKIFDFVQKHRQNCVLDGTFSDYVLARKNIERSLGRNRDIGIFYMYQEASVAWEFTKKREKLEGRYVPRKFFAEAYINAQNNVIKIKEEFSNKVELNIIIQNKDNHVEKTFFNVNTVEKDLRIKYTIGQLAELLN